MKTGIVLLGHGSRAAVDEANQVLLALAEMVGAKAGADLLEAAFLNPRAKRQNLAEAVGGLISRGAQKIIVVPVFLANGLHVQQDIPAEIGELREKYRVEITLARCLGADPRIADIILDRIGEVAGFGFFDRAAGH
jgi:sirohydrochlorin ferrochelatase